VAGEALPALDLAMRHNPALGIIAEVMASREMLLDIPVLVRFKSNPTATPGQCRQNLLWSPHRIRSEGPDERHSELAYRRRLVRQLQLRSTLPAHLCPGAG
jgi:hypothetical protein